MKLKSCEQSPSGFGDVYCPVLVHMKMLLLVKTLPSKGNRGFQKHTQLEIIQILALEALLCENEKIQ